MRKLASVQKIDLLNPIEGADAIEVAHVGGWKAVVKKGEFKEGELIVYLEVDSWVPTELAPFLSKGKEPREFNGVKGERLKTIKLRGQLSQGLVLSRDTALPMTNSFQEGDDLTEFLGIQKWEKAIPAQLAGIQRGNFPTEVPKTDQERIQNLKREFESAKARGLKFEVTEKLEGSSCTFFLDKEGEFHVCSRNIDLKETEGNSFWQAARKYDVENKMRAKNLLGFAIQGELIGPGIQGNIYEAPDVHFMVFDIYDTNLGEYLKPQERVMMVEFDLELFHVPILAWDTELLFEDIDAVLSYADGRSKLGGETLREGIVFKEMQGGFTFKAVSNLYLLGEK